MEASATLRFVTHTLSLFPHTPISSISVSPKFSSNTTLSVAKKKSSIEGVSEELNAMTSQNLDFAPSRRRVRAAFTEVHQQLDHFLFKVCSHSSIHHSLFMNSNCRGFIFQILDLLKNQSLILMFQSLPVFVFGWQTRLLLPGSELRNGMKGILGDWKFSAKTGCLNRAFHSRLLCVSAMGIAKRIDASGYGVYAMDYPGFGLSEGLHGYIPKFDDLVDDVIEHYTKIKARPEVRGLPRFILGQSMGRAIALKFHLKEPNTWDGVILVAPMCKVSSFPLYCS
ncbi:Monoglyceride lipase [Glycine soja]